MSRGLIIIGDTDGGYCQWKDVEHAQSRGNSHVERLHFIRMPGELWGVIEWRSRDVDSVYVTAWERMVYSLLQI